MCFGCVLEFSRNGMYSGFADSFLSSLPKPSRRGFLAGAAAAVTAGAFLGGSRPVFAADSGADVIFTGGTIIPMTGGAPVDSLAVAGGKILAAGIDSTVMGLKSAFSDSGNSASSRSMFCQWTTGQGQDPSSCFSRVGKFSWCKFL